MFLVDSLFLSLMKGKTNVNSNTIYNISRNKKAIEGCACDLKKEKEEKEKQKRATNSNLQINPPITSILPIRTPQNVYSSKKISDVPSQSHTFSNVGNDDQTAIPSSSVNDVIFPRERTDKDTANTLSQENNTIPYSTRVENLFHSDIAQTHTFPSTQHDQSDQQSNQQQAHSYQNNTSPIPNSIEHQQEFPQLTTPQLSQFRYNPIILDNHLNQQQTPQLQYDQNLQLPFILTNPINQLNQHQPLQLQNNPVSLDNHLNQQQTPQLQYDQIPQLPFIPTNPINQLNQHQPLQLQNNPGSLDNHLNQRQTPQLQYDQSPQLPFIPTNPINQLNQHQPLQLQNNSGSLDNHLNQQQAPQLQYDQIPQLPFIPTNPINQLNQHQPLQIQNNPVSLDNHLNQQQTPQLQYDQIPQLPFIPTNPINQLNQHQPLQLQNNPGSLDNHLNQRQTPQLQYDQSPQLPFIPTNPINQLNQHQFQNNDNSIVPYKSYTEPLIEKNNRRKTLLREKPYSRLTERNQTETDLVLSQDLQNLMNNTNNNNYSPQPRQLRTHIEMRDDQGDDNLSSYLTVARQNRFSQIPKYENYLEQKSFLCTICNTYFETEKKLRNHVTRFHDEIFQSERGMKRKDEEEINDSRKAKKAT